MKKLKKKLNKEIKKVDKYDWSIISLLVLGGVLIACIWMWFDMKDRQLEEQLRNKQALSCHMYNNEMIP